MQRCVGTLNPARSFLILTLVVLTACSDSAGPSTPLTPVDWLKANAVTISAAPPGGSDFRDLEPLRAAIGDARVVLLGEPTNGDGTTFLQKARLIQFLHLGMGFDVLAFESGLYDMDRAWRQIQDFKDADAAMRSGIHGIWTGSTEFLPVMAYVASNAHSNRKLELAGFDIQFSGTAS